VSLNEYFSVNQSINQSILYFSVEQNVTEYNECKNTNVKVFNKCQWTTVSLQSYDREFLSLRWNLFNITSSTDTIASYRIFFRIQRPLRPTSVFSMWCDDDLGPSRRRTSGCVRFKEISTQSTQYCVYEQSHIASNIDSDSGVLFAPGDRLGPTPLVQIDAGCTTILTGTRHAYTSTISITNSCGDKRNSTAAAAAGDNWTHPTFC